MKYILLIFLFQNFLYSESSKEIQVIGKENPVGTEKTKSTKSDKTGFVEVIDLENSKNRYSSLTEILERESGVRVRRFGGLGSYSTLSIRGSNANQVRIYIDGIPLNNSQGGEINLSDLPFDNLEKIEIYKSGSSSGFSGSAIGGSVNLITKKKNFTPSSRFSIGGGSLNTFKVQASKIGKMGDLNYQIQVGQEKSDQNFIFKTDNGTPILNQIDDKDIRRKNAQFNRYNFSFNLNYEFGKTIINFLNDFGYRRNGIPGPGNRQTEKTDREYLRNTTSIGTNTKSFYLKNLDLDTKFFYTGIRDHLFDEKSELSNGTPNSKADIAQYGIHLLPTLNFLNQKNILRFLFALERESFIRDRRNALDVLLDKSTKKFRNHSTWQVQNEIKLFSNKLILTPQIQHEVYIDRYNPENDILFQNNSSEKYKTVEFTNYRFGFLFTILKTESNLLNLKSNISNEKRMPDFLELFGERGSVIGNTNLKTEKSINSDFGFVHVFEKKDLFLQNSISFFRKEIKDMILFIPNSQFTLRPENIDSANITGFELSNKLKFQNLKLESNYTYQKAINQSEITYLNGKYLPLRPLHEWHGLFAFKKDSFEIGYDPIFIGAVFKDRANEYQNYQASRLLHNVYFTYFFIKSTENSNKELSINFEIKNITDKRAEDNVGYPLPGRIYYFTLSAKF